MGFEPTTTGITIQDSTAELQPPLTGAPDRIRTCYPRLRRPVLYPDELRAHSESNRRTRGSGWRDLNPRHLAPKASALPGCATPRPACRAAPNVRSDKLAIIRGVPLLR